MFATGGFHEFFTGRHIKKQIPDDNRCSPAVRGGNHLYGYFTPGTIKFIPFTVVTGRRNNRHPADSANASKRLTAKPEGADRKKIISLPDFTGRMPEHAFTQIFRRHANAVIDDFYQRKAGILNDNTDRISSGIDTVFDEFLYYRCRALNDFAGRNFFNDQLWKNFYRACRLHFDFSE
jgi:hypothetical protein